MTETLLPPTFLFRYSVACLYHRRLWSERGVQLGPEHRLPSFGELEDRPLFADVRVIPQHIEETRQLLSDGLTQDT